MHVTSWLLKTGDGACAKPFVDSDCMLLVLFKIVVLMLCDSWSQCFAAHAQSST